VSEEDPGVMTPERMERGRQLAVDSPGSVPLKYMSASELKEEKKKFNEWKRRRVEEKK